MKQIGHFTISLTIVMMVIFMLAPQTASGQSTANYAYSTSTTGSLTDMSSGTTDLLPTGVFRQNAVSPVTDIGFTFYYMSTAYTQFSISSNGQMRLGPVVISYINYTTPAANQTLLAPMSGFNSIQISGKVHYKVTGTAPDRVLIVEWIDFRIPILNSAGTFSRMQVLLYETIGKIEYVYGTMFNNGTSQVRTIFHSASNVTNMAGWIGGINTAAPTYNTTATVTQTSLANNSAIANLTSAADGSRRVFSFTPPAGPPTAEPAWAADPITNVTTAGMKLNWIDNSSNESGFLIQRSLDDITYTTVATLGADITSWIATGLTPSTLYYWKVAAFREAAEPLYTPTGGMSTTASSTFLSIASGNWSSAGTWSTGAVPTLTDDVVIDNGHTVTIDAPGQVAKTLTVNGALTYSATTVSGLTVGGDVTVNATGSFTSPASGTIVTHTLYIGGSTATGTGGNLLVDGIFNMSAFPTAGVAVNFYGTPNNTISGSGSIINFYSLSVNKGTTNASILDVTSVITIAPPTSAGTRLNVLMGTFKLSSASVLTPYFGTTQATAAGNARLWLNNADAIINSVGAGTAGGSAGTLSFGGMLQIDAGTLSHGNGASSISIFGHFSMGGANATLNVYGSFGSGSSSIYTITAGNINIYPQVVPNYVPAGYFSQGGLFQFGGSQLNFTGGTLTIYDPTLAVSSGMYYAPISLYITAGTNNLAGSTIRFGDGISDLEGSINGFTISTGATALGNVIVNNAPASVKTTRTVKLAGHSTIGGNLTINAGTANQFLVNGFMLTARGNIANSGTLIFDVTAPGNTTSGLTFSGIAQQAVSGTGTFSTNVNNLIINNTSGVSPEVDLQFPLSVSNSLTLTRGTLGSSNSSALTIGRTGYPAFTLNRSGGSLASAPVFDLAGVTTFNVTYSAPSPAASITTGVELPAATPITLFTITNASGVTLDKPVSTTTLALTAGILTTTGTNNITVTGSLPASITGGSATAYVNGPLTRTIPSGVDAANYKFPVGSTAYELFEYAAITTGGTGNATFAAEALDTGPYAGTAGTGLSSVNDNKYWSLSADLGAVTITSSTVRLTDAGLISTNKMGQSNSALGTYNSIGGTVGGSTTLASVSPVDYSAIATGTFFRVGQAGAFAAGNYAIGPQASYAGYAGTFVNMTAAVSAITAAPLPGHVIFEFQSDYNPSVETYPIALNQSIASSSGATITFRPAADVTTVINFLAAGQVLANTGADYIIFDGRNGGTGTNRFLQFTNTSTAGSVVTLSTDAQYNQILYCVLKGSTITASTGILTINASPFYTISQSNFDGSGLANNCIYASGASSDATISNNNFFDYRNGAGINLTSGNNNGVIDANNFYQTTAYNGFAGTTYGIYVASGDNCQIKNNNIGGSGPGITGTWTVSATAPAIYHFTGLYASLGTTSKIYNNKIQNFDWKSNASTWTGMNVSGSVNVGTDGANFIGSNVGNDNIKVTYFATGAAQINGILAGGAAILENNIIGSITSMLNTGITGTGCSFTGINSTGTGLINNNTIGSATTPLSINTAPQTTNNGAQNVYGFFASTGGAVLFTNNTIANINNGSTVASGVTRGILRPNTAGTINITGNSIYSLSTSQPVTGSGFTAASLDGINDQANVGTNITITGNTIYDLVNTAPAAVNINGIYHNGNPATIERNYIHSFKTSSNTAVQNGVNINYGSATLKNNIIRLGTDKDANSITSTAQINGILKSAFAACNFYFNTVYIVGSGVDAGAVNTHALNIVSHSTEDVRDNILFNARSGGGTNYAIRIPTGTPAALTSDYNDLYVSGTGGILGNYGVNQATLTEWQTATGNDLNSQSVDPQFTSPTNLIPLNVALAAGIPIAGITTDFAGLSRNATTPTIGAYEYVFPGPTAFAVTGSGSYFAGGIGLPVGLAGSETGVTYTLFKDDVAQVPTVPGTGSPISFGDQLFGLYTVSGTNLFGTTLMTGNATITELPLPNVALNKPATSESATITGYEPSMANDADGTNNSFWDGSGYPKWWKVDLGGVYDLSAIVIRNYVDGLRYYQYNIEASLDDQTYTQFASNSNTNAATDAGDAFSVSVTARYLRVNMTYNSVNTSVHISDFRAYGTVNTSSHVITAIAGTGGSISPSGAVDVANGSDQTFTITPDVYYRIADVLVDGGSAGAVPSHTFTNVTADHTISATFAALENVALNKTATSESFIITGYEPSMANDADGTNNSFWDGSGYPKWWKVDLGGVYDLSAIVIRNYVDGLRYYQYNIEASLDDQTYTQFASNSNTNAATDAGDAFSVSVTARYLRVNMTYNSVNTSVHISDFRAYGTVNTSSHVITAIAGTGGSISPSGAVDVANGSDQTFTITPDVYYRIADVLVDGGSAGAVPSHTFTNVTADHTISATFAALENVALNKTATSESFIITGYEPSMANDADGTNNSFWDGSGYPKWWKVDLGGVYDLSAIVIRNYVDGLRYYQYNIEASLDDQTYTQFASNSNTNAATDAGDAFSVSVTARYLRVNMTYNSVNTSVHISDFRAYGTVNTSSHVITAIAGTGGSISPSGAVDVANGSDQTFTITPDVYYRIADVLVDGGSAGAVPSHTFTNVTADHTISATFAALENVALNKTATSESFIITGYEPSMANDADGTNNSFWDGSGYPKWWKVDLGGVYDLSAIVIRNYVDGLRYYQYNIEASLDDQIYTQFASNSNTNAATDAGDAFSVSVTARYLRVNMTYNSVNTSVHISDFRAYGTIQPGAKGSTPSGKVTGAKVSNPSDIIINQDIKAEESYPGNIKLNVYPNPVRDRFTVRIDSPNEEMFNVSVISLQGGSIHLRTEIPANTDNTFNLQLTNGIYILRVNHKGLVMTQRIVKY